MKTPNAVVNCLSCTDRLFIEWLSGVFQRTVYGALERVQWQVDGRSFWYAQRTANGNEFALLDAGRQIEGPAFGQARQV